MPAPSELELISVILPTYNRARYVTDAMDSVWAQDYRPIELIVVDDGSTDDTEDVVRAWQATHSADAEDFTVCFLKQENQGAPAARNHGLREAMGAYTKFLDSDDLLATPHGLHKQVEETQQTREREIVFGDLGSIGENGEEFVGKEIPANCYGNSFIYLLDLAVNTPLPLHKTRLLREIGGFREDLRKGQEYDLHLRLAARGVAFSYHEGVVAYVRQVGDDAGISNNISIADDPRPVVRFHDNRRDLARAYYDDAIPPVAARLIARGYWSIGRHLYRHDRPELARYCFGNARDLVERPLDALEGSLLYKAVALLLGPFRAEEMLSFAKDVASALRPG